jgi:hypothetical protein
MLRALVQLLDPFDDLSVLLALHRDRNRHATHDEGRTETVVLCDRLEVGHLEAACWLLEDISKILGEETVETFEGAEAEDPVVGKLGRSTTGLSKVIRISARVYG